MRPGIGEVEFQTDAEEPPHRFLFVHLPPKLGMARAGMTNTIAVGIAVQSDWDNRQFSSSRSLNVHRLFEFLSQFGKPTKLFDIYVFLLLNSGTFLVSLSYFIVQSSPQISLPFLIFFRSSGQSKNLSTNIKIVPSTWKQYNARGKLDAMQKARSSCSQLHSN